MTKIKTRTEYFTVWSFSLLLKHHVGQRSHVQQVVKTEDAETHKIQITRIKASLLQIHDVQMFPLGAETELRSAVRGLLMGMKVHGQ